MSEVIPIIDSKLYLGVSIVFLFCSLLNFLLKIGIQKLMFIAFIRSIVQLLFLGIIISSLFSLSSWFLIIPIMVMILIASFRNGSLKNLEQVFHRYVSIFFSVIPMGIFTLFIIGSQSLSSAKMVIPIFGMLIGNSLNGVALGIDRFESELKSHRDLFISDLSFGLSATYAAKKYIQVALKAAMTPILNAMSIVGIVSIPGMMTGQILSGASPFEASKYQLLILVCIMGTIFVGAIVGILITLKSYVQKNYMFLTGKLRHG